MAVLQIFLLLGVSVFAGWQILCRRRADLLLQDARAQIQLRERKVQTILDHAPIVFSAIDANGIFHISEGKGLENLGRKSNESVGLSIYDIHNQNPVILDVVARALKGEQVATSFVLRGITFDLFMVPEKDQSGVVTGVSMLSVDISDRKKIEEEKAHLLIREQSAIETLKLKSEFIATMSHEIRTPINGVMGMAGLLLETPLSSEQKEYAEAIRRSGDILLTIVNDILDFSKIEAGKLDFEEISFDLPEVIHHAIKNLKFTAEKKGIELMSEVAPNLQSWVVGDPGRFRQILNNLIGNAIKFTEVGQVRVRVKPFSEEPGPSQIRVEIQDTGIGIPRESLGKMFIAFSQAEASMARRFGGTGLGLSISKQLVEKMGGQIGVESEAGKGSTFWFTVSFKNAKADKERRPASEKTQTPVLFAGNRPPNILVAEDNEINQIITVRMLKKMGCITTVAASGIQTLEALKNFDFDLVLMDCQMPEMDGYEATRRFRAGELSRNRGIPILAMTANAMKGDEEKCLASGMDGYISKPISGSQLAKVISQWLERSSIHSVSWN
jgi:signal transduction histidine kinase/ActR/RegA family two-component response regulator